MALLCVCCAKLCRRESRLTKVYEIYRTLGRVIVSTPSLHKNIPHLFFTFIFRLKVTFCEVNAFKNRAAVAKRTVPLYLQQNTKEMDLLSSPGATDRRETEGRVEQRKGRKDH